MTTARTDRDRAARHKQLATIHIAAARLFGDVSQGGDGRAAYEGWLERLSGARSAAALDDDGRQALIAQLRAQGVLASRHAPRVDYPSGKGLTPSGEPRPTPAQWYRIDRLARAKGWDRGLNDPRLAGFVRRTAKVGAPSWLTRRQASRVISGLEHWLGMGKPKRHKRRP
ncbi:MAG: phage protein GemA/Gp16 family protein [Hyphomicrobiales bacterium]